MKQGLKLHFNINSSHVANRNVCCMLLSKSLGDKHANYIIQNHDHLGSRRPHTQSTCNNVASIVSSSALIMAVAQTGGRTHGTRNSFPYSRPDESTS